MTGLNLIVTVVKLRAPGMTPFRMPIFTWMSLITGLLIIWAFPPFTAAAFMLLLDRQLGTHLFNVSAGGDPVLWQHLFWFLGHPEVYMLVLPSFGIVSEVVPVFSRKRALWLWICRGLGCADRLLCLLRVGTSYVYGRHGQPGRRVLQREYDADRDTDRGQDFQLACDYVGRKVRLTTAMLFAVGLIAMFTIGGLSGVHFAIAPIARQTTDTYYLVAHFHYVMFAATCWRSLQAPTTGSRK